MYVKIYYSTAKSQSSIVVVRGRPIEEPMPREERTGGI